MLRFGLPVLLLLVTLGVAVFVIRDGGPSSPSALQMVIDPSTKLEDGLYIIDLADSSGWHIEDGASGGWSPDGTVFAYNRSCEQPCGFGLLNVTNGTRIEVSGGNVAAIAWSPDSLHVAFSVHEPSDQAGTYVVNADGEQAERLSQDAADRLAWVDEGQVAIVKGETRFAIDVTSGASSPLNEDGPLDVLDVRLIFGKLSPDKSLSASFSGDEIQVWRIDGSLLATIPKSLPGFDWSPDGDQLLFATTTGETYPVWWLLDANDLSKTELTGVGLGASWIDEGLVVSTNLYCGPPPTQAAVVQATDVALGAETVLANGSEGPIAGALVANHKSQTAVYGSLSQGSPTLELASLRSIQPLATADGGFNLAPGMFTEDGRFLAVVVGSGHGICD